MLRSDLCDFSDAYIVLKGTITAEQNTNGNNDGHNKPFPSNPIQGGPFRDCSRTGGSQKSLPFQNLLHISYIDETRYSYTLSEEDSKTTYCT